MSQHHYQTSNYQGEAVSVLAGWDRSLGYFFLVVERDTAGEEEELIYSNFDDPCGGLSRVESFDYYREILAELGIDVPVAMLEAIEQDRMHGIGNRVENWTPMQA